MGLKYLHVLRLDLDKDILIFPHFPLVCCILMKSLVAPPLAGAGACGGYGARDIFVASRLVKFSAGQCTQYHKIC